MRKLERFQAPDPEVNTLFQVYRTVSFWKVFKNTLINEIARYYPFMAGKRNLYRRGMRMKIGTHSAVAFKVTMDLFFPEKITIGQNTIIGFHSTILTHEYLIKEYHVGNVTIGDNVMIGANVTVLPGVRIGDNATIAAGAVVSKDVPSGSFAYGNPLQIRD